MFPVACRDRCWFLRMKCTFEGRLGSQAKRGWDRELGFSVSRRQAGANWVGVPSSLFISIKVALVKNIGPSPWTENPLLELLLKLCCANSVLPFLLA